jgi:hypothetical protein
MDEKRQTLPVVVDKSHLITIGEQLYSESIELIRELVNNAYDADATKVDVTIYDEMISVEDNGLGMNLDGLKQYFSIGSPLKKQQIKSKLYGRDLIGQFGIGKFASLSACEVLRLIRKNMIFLQPLPSIRKNGGRRKRDGKSRLRLTLKMDERQMGQQFCWKD